jgi:hypothetical protein
MKKFALMLAVIAAVTLATPQKAQASTCFRDYESTVIQDSCGLTCRLDAAVDLAGCVRRAL